MIPRLNPYRHLLTSIRRQLQLEQQLMPEDRAMISWQLLVEFLGTRILVGKGGANTMFWVFGNSKRKLGYPNDLCDILERLAKQTYPRYMIQRADGTKAYTFRKASALKEPPNRKDCLYGVDLDGGKHQLYVGQVMYKTKPPVWAKIK